MPWARRGGCSTRSRPAAARSRHWRADALPAHVALRCATLGGARAVGLDGLIGSIVPGKAADLCAVALRDPETQPCYDPVSHLVYAAGREHVTHVWVGGEAVLADRALAKVDARVLEKRTGLWHNKLLT